MKRDFVQQARRLWNSSGARGWNCLRVALAGTLVFALTACGAPEPPEEPDTLVTLRFAASSDLNPDIEGRPSPAVTRVYVLSNEDVFRSASYFDLRDAAEDTLGDTLLAERDVLLNPGVSLERRMAIPGEARAVGVVVDYQDIENAVWRAYISVRTGEENALRVNLRRSEVTLGLVAPE